MSTLATFPNPSGFTPTPTPKPTIHRTLMAEMVPVVPGKSPALQDAFDKMSFDEEATKELLAAVGLGEDATVMVCSGCDRYLPGAKDRREVAADSMSDKEQDSMILPRNIFDGKPMLNKEKNTVFFPRNGWRLFGKEETIVVPRDIAAAHQQPLAGIGAGSGDLSMGWSVVGGLCMVVIIMLAAAAGVAAGRRSRGRAEEAKAAWMEQA